jgi:serine/threonine protein kinase
MREDWRKVPRQLGAYWLEAFIGQGGLSHVYLATHLPTLREVAVKVLSPTLLASEEYRRRFLREARTMSALNHPHIVRVEFVGSMDGYYFLVMEYVPGASVAQILGQQALPEVIALDFVRQGLEGLHAAHKQGLVHRDLKPKNLLCSLDGCVKLVDFGLVMTSAEESRLTMPGSYVGTAQYMSPEQCDTGDAHPSSDIYAMGITLYELLVGQPPFIGNSIAKILHQHIHEPVPDPRKADRRLSTATRDVVQNMLAKKREDRPKSAEAAAEMIAAALPSAQPLPPGWDLRAMLARTERGLESFPDRGETPRGLPGLPPRAGERFTDQTTLAPGAVPTGIQSGAYDLTIRNPQSGRQNLEDVQTYVPKRGEPGHEPYNPEKTVLMPDFAPKANAREQSRPAPARSERDDDDTSDQKTVILRDFAPEAARGENAAEDQASPRTPAGGATRKVPPRLKHGGKKTVIIPNFGARDRSADPEEEPPPQPRPAGSPKQAPEPEDEPFDDQKTMLDPNLLRRHEDDSDFE